MNKEEYLKQLEKGLRRIPSDKRAPALEYYREYFEEAGPENEAAVMEEFGPPRALASRTIAELAEKSIDEPKPTVKSGVSAIWLVILSIFAVPVGVPIGIVTVILLLVVLLIVILAAFCLVLFGAVAEIGGLSCVIAGIVVLFRHLADALAILGMGLILAGAGVFALRGAFWVNIWLFRGIYRLFKKLTGEKNKEVQPA